MIRKIRFHPMDFLLLLLVFHLIGNLVWIKLNNMPPAWDEAYNTMRSFNLLHYMRHAFIGGASELPLSRILADYYGPVSRIMAATLMFFLSPHVKLVQFIGTIFFLGTILMVFLLGRALFKNDWIAVFAAFIFSFYQVVYDNSRWILLDIPMTFFILLALYFFIKSNFYEDRKYTLLAFAAAALSVLTKFQGFVYLVFPFVWGLGLVIKNKYFSRLKNFAYGFLLFLLMTLPYVIPSIPRLILYYGLAEPGEPVVDPIPLSNPITWFHHLKLFINYEITFPLFIVFLISLYYYLKSKDRYTWFLLINTLFYYFAFTLFPNKDMRFLFPVLPLTALIFARGFYLFSIKYRIVAPFLLSCIIFFNIIMYPILSFEYPAKKGQVYFVVLPFITDIALFNMKNYPVLTYQPGPFPHEEIINDLATEAKGRHISVVLIPNFEAFNDNNLEIYALEKDIENIATERAGGRVRFESEEELVSYLDEFEYFLTTPGEVGVFYQTDKEAFEQMRRHLDNWIVNNQAKILKRYYAPTGLEIWLVKRI